MLNKLFNSEDTDVYLLNQFDFASTYKLTSETVFVMGADNPPIQLICNSDIGLDQILPDNKTIFTSIIVSNVTYRSDNPVMNSQFEELKLFTDLIPMVVAERSLKGEFMRLTNFENIQNKWNEWKNNILPLAVENPVKRRKIISNFENGLSKLQDSFNDNLQYTLLLPQYYKFRDYHNPKDESSSKKYVSRLVQDLSTFYKLKKYSFSIDGHKVHLNLKSMLNPQHKKQE